MELNCEGVSCGNCQDFMHIGENMRKCALGIPKLYKAIEYAQKELAKPDYDAQIAIIGLRDFQEVKDADLSDLAWAIYRDGCAHKNDVLGFIELLEKRLATPKEGR